MGNIKAKVIQHSKHFLTGKELVTYEIELPRIILAEVNTHKQLVRNTQSSRAVPIKSAIEQLKSGNNYMPSYWGKKQPGMTAKEECNNLVDSYLFPTPVTREYAWTHVMDVASNIASAMDDAEYHKQEIGRLIEPFMMIRMVISGTEWDNFFNLRIEPSAQPAFRELAVRMYLAVKNSEPVNLYPGEWHLPYMDRIRNNKTGVLEYWVDGEPLTLEDAQKISLSCNAQTSYRKQDTTKDKAENIIKRLFNGDAVHSSPAEHIGTPINYDSILCNEDSGFWDDGITHIDRNGDLWSAQFKDFIQYRQLIPNHVCTNFTHDKFLEYTKDLEELVNNIKEEIE